MASNQYAAFFGAFKASQAAGNPNTKEEQILAFTSGRTGSIKELSGAELEGLVVGLNQMKPPNSPEGGLAPKWADNPKGDKMRKSIIAIFYRMNRSAADAKAWTEKQGVRGTKKKFNDYTNSELFTLIRVAENVLQDWQAVLRQKMKQL